MQEYEYNQDDEDEEDYDDLDLASDQVFELDPLQVDAADTPDWIYDYINQPYEDFGIDYSQLEQDILTGTDDSLLLGDDGDGGYSVTSSTPEYPDTVYGTSPSRGRYRGSSGIFTPGRGGSVRLGPNVSFPVGPLLAGGAAVTLTGDDDEETTVPAILPGDDDMDDTTTTTTPTYTLDPMGRIIPSAMATGDTPGTLKELQDFFNMYGGPGGGMGGEFAQRMADVTGAGQTAYAQQVLGMEGDDISAFDIAQEASRQQRGALGALFDPGLGPDATYADIVAKGTEPMEALSQVRGTVLPGLESAFQTTQERLEKGLTGRERQQVEQATRARFGALGRGADTAALATEIGDIMQEERGLYSQNLQDLLGIGGTTGALIGQEAYAMSPFTQAAIGSADLGPGLALAGDIGRQAAAATPSPTDIFGLEAGERQFSLNQQALEQMAEAGRLDLIAQGIGTLASGFRGGPSAGLQQQTLGTPPYFPQQSQANNPFRYF
jgi:hypothetical protein